MIDENTPVPYPQVLELISRGGVFQAESYDIQWIFDWNYPVGASLHNYTLTVDCENHRMVFMVTYTAGAWFGILSQQTDLSSLITIREKLQQSLPEGWVAEVKVVAYTFSRNKSPFEWEPTQGNHYKDWLWEDGGFDQFNRGDYLWLAMPLARDVSKHYLGMVVKVRGIENGVLTGTVMNYTGNLPVNFSLEFLHVFKSLGGVAVGCRAPHQRGQRVPVRGQILFDGKVKIGGNLPARGQSPQRLLYYQTNLSSLTKELGRFIYAANYATVEPVFVGCVVRS